MCVPRYAALLAGPEGEALIAEAEFVLAVGRATLSRGVRALVDRAPILWVARYGGPWREAPVHAEVVVQDIPFDWIRFACPSDGRSRLAVALARRRSRAGA